MPKKSRFALWSCLTVLLVVFFGGFILIAILGAMGSAMQGMGGISSIAVDDSLAHIRERTVIAGSGTKIVHIDLEGVIMNSNSSGQLNMVESFQQQMRKAVNDKDVAAIVVRIDSPGGGVTASDLLHRTMQQTNEKKPVIAYMDTVAASGGYYMACGARKIIAHETTITGSIGVIIQTINYRDLLGKVGLSMEVYKSGEFKDILSGSREPTEEERVQIQAMVRQIYERFLTVVSASRGKSVDELRDSDVADGRIYSGKDALASGMVDGNGFVEDAYTMAMKEAGVDGATVVRYTPRLSFFSALGLMGKASQSSGKIELDVSDRILPKLQPGVAYYLHLP